jgi:hypothetical protein
MKLKTNIHKQSFASRFTMYSQQRYIFILSDHELVCTLYIQVRNKWKKELKRQCSHQCTGVPFL